MTISAIFAEWSPYLDHYEELRPLHATSGWTTRCARVTMGRGGSNETYLNSSRHRSDFRVRASVCASLVCGGVRHQQADHTLGHSDESGVGEPARLYLP